MTKIDEIPMADGKTRPRIVILQAEVTIGMRLNKTRDEAREMAQEAFNKLHTTDHYPTHEEIVAECGVVIDPREDKPWPKEEDCPGCDKHRDGPHRFGCTVHGKRQMVLPATMTPDGKIKVDLP